MTLYIILVLGLYFIQVMLPSLLATIDADDRKAYLGDAIRAKDNVPEPSRRTARLQRAQQNITESLPIFMSLALLHEIHGTATGLASNGAQVFIGARILYVPVYVLAFPGLRTMVWTVSVVGLGMMTVALF
ncbi:MAG: MAPEG family protein [Myxococcota bacterium]